MKRVSVWAATAACALGLSLSALAQPGKGPQGCIGNKVVSAMQLRIAQTELMVAGLSCRQYDQWVASANTKRYNEFVTRYRPTLMNDAHKVLAKHFPTEQRLNDFLTRLANDASQRSLANMAIFCTQAVKIYDDVLNHAPVELATYSASLPMAHTHGQQPCEVAAIPAPAPVVQPGPEVKQPAPQPVVAPQPAASVQPDRGSIAAVIAANDAPVSNQFTMSPVPDKTMRPAVRKPVTPVMKPAFN